MKKRGISPVIATSLLIAMVVVVGLIVFLWVKGFTQEATNKFGQNIELVCQEVQFESSYSSSTGELSVMNLGNVPIYSLALKIERPGSHETSDIKQISDEWPITGLNQGGVFAGDADILSTATEITVIPVLRGSSNSGPRTHTCDEQFGQEIIIV